MENTTLYQCNSNEKDLSVPFTLLEYLNTFLLSFYFLSFVMKKIKQKMKFETTKNHIPNPFK